MVMNAKSCRHKNKTRRKIVTNRPTRPGNTRKTLKLKLSVSRRTKKRIRKSYGGGTGAFSSKPDKLTLNLLDGDVLEVLASLNEEYDVIYLDPPFFTQRVHKMTGKRGHVISFPDEWDSFEEYIQWLLKVVMLCFERLSPVGTIYSHNNSDINAILFSRLPEDIRAKRMTWITWQRSHPHNNIKNGWGNIADSILVLAKTSSPHFVPQYTDLDPTYKANSFNNKDEKGNYALAPITGEKSRVGYKYTYKEYNPEYGWRKKEKDLKSLDEQGLLHFGENKVYKKVYASESKGRPVQNVWTDIYPITRTEENKRKYPTQKPVKLLERII